MLKDKVIVVTGGAGLLGLSFCDAIVMQGGIAIITDIDEENLIVAKAHFKTHPKADRLDYFAMDITSKSSLVQAIADIDMKYGKIDAMVNNAYPRNAQYGKSFFEVTYDDFNENIGLNIGGYFLCSQQFAEYFKKQGSGNIVNIASVYGVVPPKFEIYENTGMTMPVEYAAIKAAVIHLTKYMAKYFKGKNIKVNVISPGGILDSQPEPFLQAYKNECLDKGMLDAQDLQGTLVYLLSDMSRHVNGQNIIVDDGFCL